MRKLNILGLICISNLLFAGDISDYINQAKNYGSSPPAEMVQNQLNTLFCSNGTDCSYSGVDYHSFDKENEARNIYQEKASNPNDPLGQGLSTMWKLSEIKSITPYKEAEKLYECVKVSPDGKCEMYQAETYYGECKTIKECVSWNTQKFYANYTCSIDSLFSQKTGETENLCFKYNVIKPQLKEKYHTCFVVQNENIKSCSKERLIHFGNCFYIEKVSNFLQAKIEVGYPNVSSMIIGDINFYGLYLELEDFSLPGSFDIEIYNKASNCEFIAIYIFKDYHKNNPAFYKIIYNPPALIQLNVNIEEKIYPLVLISTGKSGNYCQPVEVFFKEKKAEYKCSLTQQTFPDKSTCLANCYTEEIQDCSVQ